MKAWSATMCGLLPDKINYSIPCPNTRVMKTSIKEHLNCTKCGVIHTTSILEIDCLSSHWHIARLPTNSAKGCWAMQANTWTLCNARVRTGKHGTPAPTYKGLKKENYSTNNMKYNWFCSNEIKCCVYGNKKGYILDWHVVPNIWHVKMWKLPWVFFYKILFINL